MGQREGILPFVEMFGKALRLDVISWSEIPIVLAHLEETSNETTENIHIHVGNLAADRTRRGHLPRQRQI